MKRSLSKSIVILTLVAGGLLTTTAVHPAHAIDWGGMGKQLLKEYSAPESSNTVDTAFSNADLSSAFKEALTIGVDKVISHLGVQDGFYKDAKAHIPLPAKLQPVQDVLERVGMSHLMDDLEKRLNRAAEAATPHAKEIFLTAVKDLSFQDVKKIYTGPDDAATKYFKEKTSKSLAEKMEPFISKSVSEVGVIQLYDQVMSEYKKIPFVPNANENLTDYVVNKTIDGLFLYLAKEEAAIRNNPAERTTELLKTVFGQN